MKHSDKKHASRMAALLMTLAAMTLGACSDNYMADLPANALPQDGQIRISATLSGDAQTRAGHVQASLKKISLSVINSANAKYTYLYEPMTLSGGEWTATQPLLWEKAGQEVSIFALTGQLANETKTSVDVSVLSDQRTEEATINSDCLRAYATVTPGGTQNTSNDIYYDTNAKSLRISMKHALSKLRVNVKYTAKLTTETTAVPTAVKLKDLNSTAKMDVATGSLSNLGSSGDILMYKEATTETGYVASYEAIVIPQTVTGLKIVFTVGDYNYTYTATDAKTFAPGGNHTLNITVGE